MKPQCIICGLLSCLVMALAACSKKDPELPEVSVSEVPSPKTPSIELKRGMLLRDMAAEAYGHERFYRFIMVVNGLTDETKIPAGKMLQTPSIAAAFHDAGLDPRYQPAINALAKVAMEFQAILPAYLKARETSGDSVGTFAIPQDIQSALSSQANVIVAVKRVLNKAQAPHQRPTTTIQHLEQAESWLRILAQGKIDGYGYDYDLVGQHTALSLSCAFVWMKEGYR
jgi:hypothetical protein